MRILRVRHGFQADHSSSSYLFYAADQPVSAAGQKIAHRYSSRAEVDSRSVRYVKWGESDLASGAFKALLGKHYDVMVSESYDWWTLTIAVPKTAEMKKLLAPFQDARGHEDLGVGVADYGSRLAVAVHCTFDYGGPAIEHDDTFGYLAKCLVRIRKEILQGDTSFLQAVADFYGAFEEEAKDTAKAADRTGKADKSLRKGKKPRLSRAAKQIVDSLSLV